ncbi:MAG: dihydroorotate dehydrogenase [Gemmatimonadota bacterium]|nr:MAG: dihydroorotate dehydrogenase [Gemmatimonadota bacterium]
MTIVSKSVSVFHTTFQNPILLAAGTAGFGREVARVVDLDRLGGIVTKAVSPEPRDGNAAPRVAEFSGGMLNAVGLANPGVEHVAQHELPWLAEHLSRARVLVNVVGFSTGDFAAVVRRLAAHEIITAFELNVSCPNTARGNEEFSADKNVLADLIARCRDLTDTPLVVKLPPTITDLPGTAAAAAEAGADGFTVINTIPGTVYRFDRGERPEPRLGLGKGGVSGPALLAVGVLAAREVRQRTGLPVIGVGGVCTIEDVLQYLAAGAALVGVGTASFADPRVPQRLAEQWSRDG